MQVLQRCLPKRNSVGWVKSPQDLGSGAARGPRRLRDHPQPLPGQEQATKPAATLRAPRYTHSRGLPPFCWRPRSEPPTPPRPSVSPPEGQRAPTPGASSSSSPRKAGGEEGRNYFTRVQLAPCPWHETAPRREAGPRQQHPALPQLLAVLEQSTVFQKGRDSARKLLLGRECLEKINQAGKKKFLPTSCRLQGPPVWPLTCQSGRKQRAPGTCSPCITDLGTDFAFQGLICLCALMLWLRGTRDRRHSPDGRKRTSLLWPVPFPRREKETILPMPMGQQAQELLKNHQKDKLER